MWESRSVFCGGFSKLLVEIIKKKLPKATFIDFHSSGIYAEVGINAVIPSSRLCRVELGNACAAWFS